MVYFVSTDSGAGFGCISGLGVGTRVGSVGAVIGVDGCISGLGVGTDAGSVGTVVGAGAEGFVESVDTVCSLNHVGFPGLFSQAGVSNFLA